MTLPHESKEGQPAQGEAKETVHQETTVDRETGGGVEAEDTAVEQSSGATAQDHAAEGDAGGGAGGSGDGGGSE